MRNFQAIVDVLNGPGGDGTDVTIVDHTDSICTPCPNRREKLCTTEEEIRVLDHAHATALEISPNEVITWGQAKSRIAEKMSLKKFHEICQTCGWKKLGICEQALTAFLEGRPFTSSSR